jgi:hypothetical protein
LGFAWHVVALCHVAAVAAAVLLRCWLLLVGLLA